MALQIHSAPSADLLLDELVRQLSVQHADPFGRDVVVVPSSGMREYLIENLCRRLPARNAAGPLLANVEFIYPGEFNMRVLGHRRSASDQWSAGTLRWSLLAELERDPDLLPGYREARRKLGRAEKAAMLFEKYSAQRPTMLVDWSEGKCTDGFGALDEDRVESYGWQYTLWRRARERLGVSHAEELRARTPAIEPGARYWLFALEFFSPAKITLLAQLGEAPIGVFMLQAPAAAETVMIPGAAQGQAIARSAFKPGEYLNPLNRSWAGIAHETYAMVGALAGAVGASVQRTHAQDRQTLLGRLQQAIVSDVESPVASTLAAGDRSLQVHLCHGAARQVQVLRDVLLHLFNNDSTLHPRDVLVHCLDLDTFAPLVAPLLAAGGIPVPVTIVDRSVTTRTRVETAIDSLLTVLEQRCTLDEFRDLLSHNEIIRSVDLTADDVALFEEVLPSLDVRWGLDGEHRARFGYSADDEISTLRHAIDRALLGALVQGAEGHEVLRGITPVTDVDGQTAVAVGKVSVLVSALQTLARRCDGTHSIAQWGTVLRTILDDFLRVDRDDEWMLGNLEDLAVQLAEAGTRLPDITLASLEFFALVRSTLSGAAGRSRQWADAVRIATPETLRGVPARVVVMLGMDEQRLRKGGVDGDDLLTVTPHVGDRDPRSEHRLGLLTAICSATDALVLVADGHSVTDNAEIPLAMPVRELIDQLAGLCGVRNEADLPFVVHHSRQATDVVNLGVRTDEGKKNVDAFCEGPFTFDAGAIPIARKAQVTSQVVATIGLPAVLAAPADDELQREISIRHLVRSVARPAEVYFHDRLRLRLPDEEGAADDELELWPSGLGNFDLGDGLVTAAVEGLDLDEWMRTRTLEGGVPPGALGGRAWAGLRDQATALAEKAALTGLTATPHSLIVPIPDTNYVVRDVVQTFGDELVQLTFSSWKNHRRLGPLFSLAALTCHDDSRAWSARIVARGPNVNDSPLDPPVAEAFVLAGETPAERRESAHAVLRFAAGMRDRALRSPVMAFEEASWVLGVVAPSNEPKALRRDLYQPIYAWLWPDATPGNEASVLRALRGIEGGELENDLPPAKSAADQYAKALREMWTTHVVVTEHAVPPVAPAAPRGRKVAK